MAEVARPFKCYGTPQQPCGETDFVPVWNLSTDEGVTLIPHRYRCVRCGASYSFSESMNRWLRYVR